MKISRHFTQSVLCEGPRHSTPGPLPLQSQRLCVTFSFRSSTSHRSVPTPSVSRVAIHSSLLSFHRLTNCPSSNSFLLTSLQMPGGVGGTSQSSFLTSDFQPLTSFFSHSSTLFCVHGKLNSFLFNQFRTLSQKHRGWGYPSAPRPPRPCYHSSAARNLHLLLPDRRSS